MNHPSYAKPQNRRPHLQLAYPGVMIVVLFVLPLLVMIALSFFRRVQGGFFEPAFVFRNYEQAFSPFFLERIWVSLAVAAIASLLCVIIGFPFTFILTRFPRSKQVPAIVVLLSVISLSEVIIAFSWSLLLSRTSGISNVLVLVGLFDEPTSWSPGFGAMLSALVYIALPLCVVVLYPSVSRLDTSLIEAATTLGASPSTTVRTVILPSLRQPLLATFILLFVFVLGSYLIPQVLGRPQHWTLPVHITDQALLQSNMPLAAALALLLLVASASLSLITLRLGNQS
jgi:putative spermidine/putrescine transport system permease protein